MIVNPDIGSVLRKGVKEMLESGTDGMGRRPRYWTLGREGSSHLEVFTIDQDGRGEALVVFGFEEEAELFLGLEEKCVGWQARETTTGELVSMLYGPCANVDRVMIDPLPQRIASGIGMQPLSMSSKKLTRSLMSSGGAAAGATPALATLHP